MNRKGWMIFGGILLMLFSSPAYAASGGYVGISLGVAMLNDTGLDGAELDDAGLSLDAAFEAGAVFGLSVGYAYDNNLRMELEVSGQSNNVDSITGRYEGETERFYGGGDVTSSALLVNAYYDFVNTTRLTPFVMAGVGFSTVEMTIEPWSDQDTVLAWQAGGGIGYAVNENLTLDVAYRYFGTQDPDFGTISYSYSSHNILVGIRYRF